MKLSPSAPALSLALPAERSVPAQDLGDYSILIYGQEKIGKTSLAAQFPDALFFMFEPGAKHLSIYQREIESWKQFKDYLKLVSKSKRFKTLVIDTADIAHSMCTRWVCQEEGIDHPSDGQYGKGWSAVSSEFSEVITGMLKMGRGVILTSHAAEKEIKTRLGDQYDRIVPTMAKGARATCEAIVDIWGYMYYGKDGDRMLRIRGNDHVSAGVRPGDHFKGIEVIPLGRDDATAYRNFVAAFNNDLSMLTPKKGLTLGKTKN